jgi:uncharacterized protein (DUF983 family)
MSTDLWYWCSSIVRSRLQPQVVLLQGIGRAQEQVFIKAQTSSCLDSATMLQLLQQQQHESRVQGSADQAGRVSVGCQTRQGDTWRVHSEACQGKPAEESGSWAQHGNAVISTCIIVVVTVMMIVAVMLSFMSVSLLLSLSIPVPLSSSLSLPFIILIKVFVVVVCIGPMH